MEFLLRKIDFERVEVKWCQILDVVIDCFVCDGFYVMFMVVICKVVGMSLGNLFYYFLIKVVIIEVIVQDDQCEMVELFVKYVDVDDVLVVIEEIVLMLMELLSDFVYVCICVEIVVEVMCNLDVVVLFVVNEVQVKGCMVVLIKWGVV